MSKENVYPIEWWDREDFKGRATIVQTYDKKDGHTFIEENKIPIPDNSIVCDLCNDEVDEFPCAIMGSHALCKACRVKSHIEPGDNEYFETMAYALDLEKPKPRVNFGGRKKR